MPLSFQGNQKGNLRFKACFRAVGKLSLLISLLLAFTGMLGLTKMAPESAGQRDCPSAFEPGSPGSVASEAVPELALGKQHDWGTERPHGPCRARGGSFTTTNTAM